MHLCAKVALASKVLQDLKLQKPDCPVAKPWGEKKDPPAITQITSLVLFFPTSWQQLTTPSEVQLSYRYKTFHNSQKNKDTQNRILLLITWYISAHKKHERTALFKLLSAWYAILLSLIVLPMLLNTGRVWCVRLLMPKKATKGKQRNPSHWRTSVFSACSRTIWLAGFDHKHCRHLINILMHLFQSILQWRLHPSHLELLTS